MRWLLAILAVCVVTLGLGIAGAGVVPSLLVAVAVLAAGVVLPWYLDERPRELHRERQSARSAVRPRGVH